jgi:hypothetical protein
VLHDADREVFEATLRRAVETGVLKGKLTAIIDSSPVHGAGAVADTYVLVRKILARVVRAGGGRLDPAAVTAAAPFIGDKPDIDWQDPVARKALLQELVTAAGLVLASSASIEDDAVREAAGLLGQVLGADLEVGDDGVLQVCARAWPGTGSSRTRIRRCATAESRRLVVSMGTSSM